MGWAVLLGRVCTLRGIWRSLIAGSIVATLGAALSLIHHQAFGGAFFQLPVGPITLTSSLGALWTSIAVVWLIGSVVQRCATLQPAGPHIRPSIAGLAFAGIVVLLSLLLLVASGRRGAWMGLLAGGGVAAGMASWARFTSMRSRAVMVATALAGLAATGWFVRSQAQSADVAVSLPLKFRSIYWETMLTMIPRSPIWGCGPDQFVVKTTTALARQRAEQPRVLHGTRDSDGHNEWLQAAFELGIPGGLLYLALPLGALVAGWKRWKQSEGVQRVMLLALMTGLVVVCVSEASSINLRHPILQGWYWTLLGMMVALGRGRIEAQGLQSLGWGVKRIVRRAAVVLAAVFIVAVVAIDLRAVMHHAKGRALLNNDDAQAARELELATSRFGTSRWLTTRTDLGTAQANVLRNSRVPAALRTQGNSRGETAKTREWGPKAISTWRQVVRASPGYLDSGFRLAEAQTSAGDTDGAVATLDSYLRDVNPYDTQANVLLVNIADRPPVENLEAVCRGLRSGPMSRWLVSAATRSLGTAEAMSQWPAKVDQVRRDVAQASETDWKNPLAPETLRVEALRFATLGRLAEAAQVQRLAAETYRRLDATRSPVARPMPAVADAWYLAARFLFDSDPTQFETAYKMMLQAEQSVRLGVAGDVDDLGKQAELEDVVLASRTEDLCQLMRFSAKMHLIAQQDLRPVQLRIGWSLAGHAYQQEEIHAELGLIAAELVKTYGEMPEPRRPCEFMRIVDIARRYLPTPMEGSK